MSPITRFRDTFAKPGVDPRVVERIQGINVETGRLSVGRAGKEFYVPEQPAEVMCYIAGEDFDLPFGFQPQGEVGAAVVDDQCILYGDIRRIDGDLELVEFDLPSEAWPLFPVGRSILLNRNAFPPEYVPLVSYNTNLFDSFSSNTLEDADKWITKYGEDAIVSNDRVVGDWIGMMVNSKPALGSRTTVKFRKTGAGSVDIVAAVRAQWKPEVLYDYNLWGIWGRCRSGGIELMAWGDEDASHDGAVSGTTDYNIATGVDYWLRTTVNNELFAEAELFDVDPGDSDDAPVASIEHDFLSDLTDFPAVANLQVPGQAGAHNQSFTPNVYIDDILYEIPQFVNDYSFGALAISELGKISVTVPGATLLDGTLIQFGQLQYTKK